MPGTFTVRVAFLNKDGLRGLIRSAVSLTLDLREPGAAEDIGVLVAMKTRA